MACLDLRFKVGNEVKVQWVQKLSNLPSFICKPIQDQWWTVVLNIGIRIVKKLFNGKSMSSNLVFLTKCFGVGVSGRKLYSFVVYLYVNGSGSITSVGEERANLSAVVYLLLCGFCLERFPLPLGAWDGLRYFIVALPEPSI